LQAFRYMEIELKEKFIQELNEAKDEEIIKIENWNSYFKLD
jgi:hypothetical protein